jgi:hypothetical protein
VIEHVYDIEDFFNKLPSLGAGPLSIVMSSGANQYNPRVRKAEMKKQIEVEQQDRKKDWGYKERDCFESYLKVRERLVRKYLKKSKKQISETDIHKLAVNTRGMIESGIKASVEEYLKSGTIPSEPDHPTNTCDPFTGNWAEHLMNPYLLADILEKKGFNVKVMSGYYSRSKSTVKRMVGKVLNILIFLTGRLGLTFSPFYTVYGRRD